MTRVSALAPLAIAIVRAVENDATLAALLADDLIYQGEAPPGAAMPYIVLAAPAESGLNLFNRAGTQNAEQIHIWADGGGHYSAALQQVRSIASEVMRVLANDPLPMPGFEMIGRDVALVTVIRDPDSPGVAHGVLRFTPRLVAWPWTPPAGTQLTLAAHQTGGQVVRATMGEDGVLGATAAAEATDPVVTATRPFEFDMAEAERFITIGAGGTAPLDDPTGFTVLIAARFGAAALPGSVLFSEILNVDAPPLRGLEFYAYEDLLGAEVHFGQTDANMELATTQIGMGDIVPGRTIVGFRYDAGAAFGARIDLWKDGTDITEYDYPAGVDGAPDFTGLSLRWGARQAGAFSATAGPAAEGGMMLVPGLLTPAEMVQATDLLRSLTGWP